MNEEEKQAIQELKEEINKPMEVPEDKFNTFILYNIKSTKTILNLIEKQQKEIERLKNLNKNTYISKDKIRHIRDKAECMDYYSLNDVIDDLSKLLGDENNE